MVNWVWLNGWQSVKPDSLMISNCLLRYSNFSLIQAIAWHWYCNHSLFIKYTERKPIPVPINTISWVICWLLFDEIDALFLDQCAIIIWYHSLRRDRDLSLKNKLFDRFLHEKWAIAQNSSTAPKAKAYHLIPQVKNLLIKLAWLTMLGVIKS